MLRIVLASCLVLLAVSQHPHPSHPTHPPHPTGHVHPTHPTAHVHPSHPTHPPTHADHGGSHDGFKFTFDDHSGYLIMTTASHCYLMMLTDAEKANVKDPLKMETVEIQMVTLAGDLSMQTALNATDVDHSVTSHCHHLPIVELKH